MMKDLKMEKKNLNFSKETKEDLTLYGNMVLELVKDTKDCWEYSDSSVTTDLAQLENDLNRMEKRILKDHKKRLKKEKYSVDIGFILSDILTGLKKVAEHSLVVMDAVQSAKME